MLERESLEILQSALGRLEAGFASLPPFEAGASDLATMRGVLEQAATRMQDNYPYFHPLYAGQMLKPPHPVARAAYALATWINPNNHALDGGRASSAMEVEAVAEIARMVGFNKHLGHLTSGGTVANLEALWVSGRLAAEQGKTALVLCSEQAHYTHQRISAVLGLRCETVAVDALGRMDVAALTRRIQQTDGDDSVTVVVTFGTTAVGAVDPLDEILRLRERYGYRVHVDAAYGGYFPLTLQPAEEAGRAAEGISEADSLVIDPHKHGLQPYGCGCVLFREPAVGRFYNHDSPYTYFSSAELHLGEITLECSRAGAAAVALWSTQKLLPLERGGEFARMLGDCRAAALDLYQLLHKDARFVTMAAPQLDIVCWAVRGATLEKSGARAREIFAAAAERDVHLALVQLPVRFFPELAAQFGDAGMVTCLRSVLMKPEHRAWVPEIWRRLDAAADTVLEKSRAGVG
jgi:glutamate/tyrosine decarboxylase-like PLP-dependent enzyme